MTIEHVADVHRVMMHAHEDGSLGRVWRRGAWRLSLRPSVISGVRVMARLLGLTVLWCAGLALAEVSPQKSMAAEPARPVSWSPEVGEVPDSGEDSELLQPRVSDWGTRDWPDQVEKRFRYLAGVSIRTSPNFYGLARTRNYGLNPMLAVEWGRLRLSTGGGSGLIGHGLDVRRDRSAGLEGVLRTDDRFNVSLSLNLDRGRGVAEEGRLSQMPDVETTVRLRARARYFFSRRLTGSVAVSQDIMGKGGGMEVDGWLGYELPLTAATRLSASVSASIGNGPYMRNEFGVPASAANVDLPAYRAKAGLFQTNVGLEIAHSISRHWVAHGGVRYVRLQADARRSPLVDRTGGASVSLGVAWRN